MYRRLRGDLIEVCKYTHDCYDTKSLFEIQEDDITRVNEFKKKNRDTAELFGKIFQSEDY